MFFSAEAFLDTQMCFCDFCHKKNTLKTILPENNFRYTNKYAAEAKAIQHTQKKHFLLCRSILDTQYFMFCAGFFNDTKNMFPCQKSILDAQINQHFEPKLFYIHK